MNVIAASSDASRDERFLDAVVANRVADEANGERPCVGNTSTLKSSSSRSDEALKSLGFGRSEFNKNRMIIIRNVPVVTYDDVKAFMGKFTVANIAISKRLRHALVTLKHGEEAEYCVQSLSNGRLKDKEVDVSLYRNDNLLCVANLPLTMEELDFRRLVEPFGQIEKGFLMRNHCAVSLGYGFVEFMHNREKSEQARLQIDLKTIDSNTIRCQFVKDTVLTFDQLYSRSLIADNLPDSFSNRQTVLEYFSAVESPVSFEIGIHNDQFLGFVVVEYATAQMAEATFERLMQNPVCKHSSARLQFAVPGDTTTETCLALASFKIRSLQQNPFLTTLLSSLFGGHNSASIKCMALPTDLSAVVNPLLCNLLQQNPSVLENFVQLMKLLGQQQQRQKPCDSTTLNDFHSEPNLYNPNLQISLLSVMLATQLQQLQPALLTNPSSVSQPYCSEQLIDANPLITQANSMLQNVLINQTAATNQILLSDLSQNLNSNSISVISQMHTTFDSSSSEKLNSSKMSSCFSAVTNSGSQPFSQERPLNFDPKDFTKIKQKTVELESVIAGKQPRPILGMRDGGQSTFLQSSSSGPASPFIAQAIETSIRGHLQDFGAKTKAVTAAEVDQCCRPYSGPNEVLAVRAFRRSNHMVNSPKRFLKRTEFSKVSPKSGIKKNSISEIQKRKLNVFQNKTLQPTRKRFTNSCHLAMMKDSELITSSSVFNQNIVSESVVASKDEICTSSLSSMDYPIDDQFSLCCDDLRFTVTHQKPEPKFPLNEVINKSLQGSLLQSCRDPAKSYVDTKKFVATPGQKRPHFLQSPEPSPEGPYVGQHSQGIGGHYADSYFKQKKI